MLIFSFYDNIIKWRKIDCNHWRYVCRLDVVLYIPLIGLNWKKNEIKWVLESILTTPLCVSNIYNSKEIVIQAIHSKMTIMWEISVDPLQSYRCLKSIKINLMREQKKRRSRDKSFENDRNHGWDNQLNFFHVFFLLFERKIKFITFSYLCLVRELFAARCRCSSVSDMRENIINFHKNLFIHVYRVLPFFMAFDVLFARYFTLNDNKFFNFISEMKFHILDFCDNIL